MYKKLSRRSLSALASGLALIVTGCLSIASTSHEAGSAITADQIKFEQIAPFVQMGGVWGDRGKGAHGTFGIMPGGQGSPLHTHSGDYHGVVISGVMINPFHNEPNPPKMSAGGYWHVPAGSAHITACISEEPGLFYFHAESAFDFAPAE